MCIFVSWNSFRASILSGFNACGLDSDGQQKANREGKVGLREFAFFPVAREYVMHPIGGGELAMGVIGLTRYVRTKELANDRATSQQGIGKPTGPRRGMF
jgi:hypothetical protein